MAPKYMEMLPFISSCLVLISLSCVTSCPVQCNLSKTSCNCVNSGVRGLNISLNTSLTSLDLTNSIIPTVSEGSFERLAILMLLNLKNSSIAHLQNGSFRGLRSLQKLWLQDNKITTIKAGMFVGLDALEKLNLNGNLIVALEKGSFLGLPELTYLYMARNRISAMLNDGIFSGVPKLLELDFTSNDISTIQYGSFSNLPELKRLYLSENRLSIDRVRCTFSSLPTNNQQYLNNYAQYFDVNFTRCGNRTQICHDVPGQPQTLRCECQLGEYVNGTECIPLNSKDIAVPSPTESVGDDASTPDLTTPMPVNTVAPAVATHVTETLTQVPTPPSIKKTTRSQSTQTSPAITTPQPSASPSHTTGRVLKMAPTVLGVVASLGPGLYMTSESPPAKDRAPKSSTSLIGLYLGIAFGVLALVIVCVLAIIHNDSTKKVYHQFLDATSRQKRRFSVTKPIQKPKSFYTKTTDRGLLYTEFDAGKKGINRPQNATSTFKESA